MKFPEQVNAGEAVKLDWAIAKDVYSKSKKESKAKKH
jgi:hypothetical protein